jgi:hypothetical protein
MPTWPAGADVIVVEHVPEAAIDEYRPGRRRLEPEAEYRTFRASTERVDVLGNNASLRRQAAGADRHPERIQNDLFDQFDEFQR